MQTLLRCPYSPRVQSHASPSVRTGGHTIVGHTDMLHTPVGMGSAALAAAVPSTSKATRISRKGQKSNIMVNYTKLLKKNVDSF